jgi:hypothetical protein
MTHAAIMVVNVMANERVQIGRWRSLGGRCAAAKAARIAGFGIAVRRLRRDWTDRLSHTGRREFRHILSTADQRLIDLRVIG